jgi:hypothetical protein
MIFIHSSSDNPVLLSDSGVEIVEQLRCEECQSRGTLIRPGVLMNRFELAYSAQDRAAIQTCHKGPTMGSMAVLLKGVVDGPTFFRIELSTSTACVSTIHLL